MADIDQNGSGESGASERESNTDPVLAAEQVIQELAVEMRRHADAVSAYGSAREHVEKAAATLEQAATALREAASSTESVQAEVGKSVP